MTLDGNLAASSGSILIDIRGTSALSEIRFYIDSAGTGAASFEVTDLELILYAVRDGGMGRHQ